ncbi:MAG TPA: PEGA domain-containing protein [Candidatus Acidoferrales bacterium]
MTNGLHRWWLLGFAIFCGVVTLLMMAPAAGAETFSVTSSPAGAEVEIDGVAVGTTPFQTQYPGGYFHKTHTVFSTRLEHRMVLRVTKNGYVLQQMTITEGPFDWIGLTGKHHGKYFILRADHFALNLEPVVVAREPDAERVGPIHARAEAGYLDSSGVGGGTGLVAIGSEPVGAEIYVDGKFVGQTPSTMPLMAGAHHVEVKAAGRMHWERDLTVVKDGSVSLKAVLEAR